MLSTPVDSGGGEGGDVVDMTKTVGIEGERGMKLKRRRKGGLFI